MKLPKIPFHWLPGSWGLRGRHFEEAKAAYYLTGYDLDRRLAEIQHEDDYDALQKALLDLDLRHGRISEYEHAVELARLTSVGDLDRAIAEVRRRFGKISEYDYDKKMAHHDHPETGVEQTLAFLDVDFKHHRLSKIDYEKERANLLEEPWFHISGGIDLEHGLNGVYLAMDWNIHWVDYLRMNGYMGATDQEVVDNWMDDVWRAQAAQADLRSEPVFVAGGRNNYRTGNNR